MADMVTIYPRGVRTRVPADVCRCPILVVGDACPVHQEILDVERHFHGTPRRHVPPDTPNVWIQEPRDLVARDGTRWVHDPEANTYQPISPDGDASVPMPEIVFARVYPELYRLFHPNEGMTERSEDEPQDPPGLERHGRLIAYTLPLGTTSTMRQLYLTVEEITALLAALARANTNHLRELPSDATELSAIVWNSSTATPMQRSLATALAEATY